MFKQVTLCAAVALAAVCAKADFLYWQVADQGEFSEAVLHIQAKNGGTEAAGLDDRSVLAEGVDFETKYTGTTTGLQQTDISAYKGSEYSFFVEMVTYSAESDDPVSSKKGYTYSYDELVSSGYVSAGGVSVPSAVAGGGLNMGSAAPEPTSGVLLLIGGAMLALRRRRRQA